MVRFLPGSYYLLSRYTNGGQRAIYVAKYWLPFVIVLWPWYTYGVSIIATITSALAFYSIYDVFCFLNDTVSARREVSPAKRSPPFGGFRFILATRIPALLCFMAVTVALAATPRIMWYCIGLFSLVSTVFSIHNLLPPRFRIVSYFALYALKGGVIALPLLDLMPASSVRRFVLFSVLYAFAYVPRYVVSKYRPDVLKSTRLHHKVLTQSFVYKNVIIGGATIVFQDYGYMAALCLIDVFTALEFLYIRSLIRHGKIMSSDC